MSTSFFYENGLDEIRNEHNEIVDDPMEDIHTEITDPRIVLETITSHKQYQENKPEKKLPEVDEDLFVETEVKVSKKSRADPNADYSLTTRVTFIDRMLEQPGGARSARRIGGSLGVHEKTAQRWWKQFEETGEVPVKKSTRNRGHPCVFTKEHRDHIQNLIDEEPQVTVTEVVDDLVAKFEDFSLSKTQVHHHMKTTCNLSVSVPQFESEKRNSLENLEERFKWVIDWKDSNVDFTKNCVFIDESGFHTNMRRNFAWSPVGKRPVVKTPVTRAITHTVLGAITAGTVLHVVLRKPPPPAPKPRKRITNKRKKTDVEAEVEENEREDESANQSWPDDGKPAPKGTTSAHYIKFVNEVSYLR